MPRLLLAFSAALFFVAFSGVAHAQVAIHSLVSPDVESYGRFGASVGPAGDVDGDGVTDIVVGAPSEGGEDLPGRAHVFSGATGASLLTVESDEPQRRGDFGFTVSGVQGEEGGHFIASAPRESAGREAPRGGNLYLFEQQSGDLRDATDSPNESPNGRFGFSLRSMVDFDDDGIRDFIAGAPSEVVEREPVTTGRAYVLSGDDADDLTEFEPPREGIRLFGYSVAGAPDIDGGDTPDVMIGALGGAVGSDMPNAGAAFAFNGEDEELLYTLLSPNPSPEGRFGSAVAMVDDANGDGVADWIVGAPGEETDTGNESGRAYLFSGADGQRLHTFVSPEGQSSGRFGESVCGGPDFNGDGAGDVLVGAPSEASSAGRVHVFSGADGTLLRTLQSPREAINGGFGSSIALLDDLDDDGVQDVVIGATGESAPDGTERSGAAYVLSGSSLTSAARASGP